MLPVPLNSTNQIANTVPDRGGDREHAAERAAALVEAGGGRTRIHASSRVPT